MEAVKKFYEALSKDEAMRAKLSTLNEKYPNAQPDFATSAAEIVAFAKSEGFAFTADDLSAYAESEGKQLSDEQLEGIVGGQYNSSTCFCLVGGGGKDSVTGRVCACVVGGGGKFDNTGHRLVCVLDGGIYDH